MDRRRGYRNHLCLVVYYVIDQNPGRSIVTSQSGELPTEKKILARELLLHCTHVKAVS